MPCVRTRLSTVPTFQPTRTVSPGFSTVLPSSKRTVPASSVFFIDLPIPTNAPSVLRDGTENPHLIVPIDKADPAKVVGNGFTALVSSSISTVFVFDIRPEYQGKTCNLVFYVPPTTPPGGLAPYSIKTPGGINVSRLTNHIATPKLNANSVGSFTPLGTVPSIQPASEYTLGSMPCDGGQRVGFQMDAIGGLTMDFFQMTSPPLGLFVVPV